MPWINGGFFVLEPGVIDYIEGDDTTWEREPLEALARDGELSAYRHTGFWQPMDTLRDKVVLEEIWQSGKAPWYNRIYAESFSQSVLIILSVLSLVLQKNLTLGKVLAFYGLVS